MQLKEVHEQLRTDFLSTHFEHYGFSKTKLYDLSSTSVISQVYSMIDLYYYNK